MHYAGAADPLVLLLLRFAMRKWRQLASEDVFVDPNTLNGRTKMCQLSLLWMALSSPLSILSRVATLLVRHPAQRQSR